MEKEIKKTEKETYVAPNIMVLDIETEQNILASTSNNIDMHGSNW